MNSTLSHSIAHILKMRHTILKCVIQNLRNKITFPKMYDTFTAALNCGLQGGSKPEKTGITHKE